MLLRRKANIVREALASQAAVALIGPRQAGKTTLALSIAEEAASLYLDLEAREDRDKLTEAALFLRDYEDRLVVLDEIHRVPELFQTLRGLIDQGCRRGRRTGRRIGVYGFVAPIRRKLGGQDCLCGSGAIRCPGNGQQRR